MDNSDVYQGTDRIFLRIYSCSDLQEQSDSLFDGFVTDEVFGIWRRYASGSEAQIGELWVQKLDLSSALDHNVELSQFRSISRAVREVVDGLFYDDRNGFRLKDEVDWPTTEGGVPAGLLHVNSVFLIEPERRKQAVSRVLKLLVNFHASRYLTCLYVRAYKDDSARRTPLDWGSLPRATDQKDMVSQVIRGLFRSGFKPVGGRPEVMFLPRKAQSAWLCDASCRT